MSINDDKKTITAFFSWLLFSLMCLVFSPMAMSDEEHDFRIIRISNLESEQFLIRQHQLPLLILFTIDDCPFCYRVKDEFLNPMIISGDYDDKVLIRELNMDHVSELTDFDGDTVSARTFAHKYRVYLYPTMIIVNENGCQLSEKIVGLNTPSMFGGRIDDAIDQALKKVRQGIC